MPRTLIAPIQNLGSFEATTLSWTAGDATNLNMVEMTGKEIILIRNNGATTQTLTLKSVEDPFGRSADLVVSLAAGATKLVGPMVFVGWQQPDGNLYLDPSSVDIQIGVLKLAL